jgi:hypothetical protein
MIHVRGGPRVQVKIKSIGRCGDECRKHEREMAMWEWTGETGINASPSKDEAGCMMEICCSRTLLGNYTLVLFNGV